MSQDAGAITQMIGRLKCGDPAAAHQLWEVYSPRLLALARGRLRGAALRVADEEDVALSAFDSFLRRAERGQFPALSDRDDLWKILLAITVCKAIDLVHHERRQSRGAGRVLTFTDVGDRRLGAARQVGLGPEFLAQMADEYRNRMERLGDESLRTVARMKLEGYTNAEVAQELGCVTQTVERKLRSIRDLWAEEVTR